MARLTVKRMTRTQSGPHPTRNAGNTIKIPQKNTSTILVYGFPSVPEGPIRTSEMSPWVKNPTPTMPTNVTCIQVTLAAHQSATQKLLPCPMSHCWCFQDSKNPQATHHNSPPELFLQTSTLPQTHHNLHSPLENGVWNNECFLCFKSHLQVELLIIFHFWCSTSSIFRSLSFFSELSGLTAFAAIFTALGRCSSIPGGTLGFCHVFSWDFMASIRRPERIGKKNMEPLGSGIRSFKLVSMYLELTTSSQKKLSTPTFREKRAQERLEFSQDHHNSWSMQF